MARSSASIAFAQALLVLASCSVDEIDLEGKSCPCATGYQCDEARQICVPSAADASVGGTAGDGGSSGGASGTGASSGSGSSGGASGTGASSGSGASGGTSGIGGSGGVAGAAGAAGSGGVQPADAGTCSDGLKNGAETDIDCGGGTCSPCANGKACIVSSDCVNKCVNKKCCGQNC